VLFIIISIYKAKYIVFQSLGVEIFMYLEFFLRKIQLQCRFLQSPSALLRLVGLRVISKQYI